MKANVITIIGSMRFYDFMMQEEKRLSSIGCVVLHPVDAWPEDQGELSDEHKAIADAHIRKCIYMSDMVYVIDESPTVENHIGESTMSEVEYAKSLNKTIVYSSNEIFSYKLTDDISPELRNVVASLRPEGRIITMIGSKRYMDWFRYMHALLTSMGFIVNIPAIFNYKQEELNTASVSLFKTLDDIHDWKMIQGRVLLIDGTDGYIGDDTKRELDALNENHSINIHIYSTSGKNYPSIDEFFDDVHDVVLDAASAYAKALTEIKRNPEIAFASAAAANANSRLTVALIPLMDSNDVAGDNPNEEEAVNRLNNAMFEAYSRLTSIGCVVNCPWIDSMVVNSTEFIDKEFIDWIINHSDLTLLVNSEIKPIDEDVDYKTVWSHVVSKQLYTFTSGLDEIIISRAAGKYICQ